MSRGKKNYSIRGILTVITILCCMGCGKMKPDFVGNKIRNQDKFLLEFQVLNHTESSTMQLKKGDEIKTSITVEEGKVDILVKDRKETIAYQGTNVATGEFSIEIQEDGTYTFAVTGDGGKGSVSFEKAETGQ